MDDTLKLHDYQRNAIDFAIDRKRAFMAIDMGLGKTVIALKMIEELKLKAVVFAPIMPMYTTWPQEIEKWGLNLTFDILHNVWKDEVFNDSEADVLLINYEGIKWFYNRLISTKRTWNKRTPIWDESSMVKSSSAQRFKMLKKMEPLWTDRRLCLSATPAPNGYQDLWSQYYLLDRGKSLYDSYTRYRGMHFHYSGPPLYKTTLRKDSKEPIQKAIKPCTFRLKAEDYLKMPELIYNEIPVTLPEKNVRQYKELETNFFLEFEKADATAFNAAALSSKLRQYIQGAVYLDDMNGEFEVVHHAKIDALKQLINASAGQPILCPINFRFELDMIREDLGYKVPCISGGAKNTVSQARHYIQQWNRGHISLLLCHPASIGHGVNLQAGGHIVAWFGMSWSLEYYKQLNGRIYRQGQRNAVVINHFVMQKTVDERVMKTIKTKDATQDDLLYSLRR